MIYILNTFTTKSITVLSPLNTLNVYSKVNSIDVHICLIFEGSYLYQQNFLIWKIILLNKIIKNIKVTLQIFSIFEDDMSKFKGNRLILFLLPLGELPKIILQIQQSQIVKIKNHHSYISGTKLQRKNNTELNSLILNPIWGLSEAKLSLFHKNPSCLKLSRALLKNDDTLLEFRRMWRFLTGAGALDHVFDVFFWWQWA